MTKNCEACRFYPNNCGYWTTELKPRKPGGSPPSRVTPQTVHNCPDFRPRDARDKGGRDGE